MSSGVSRWWNEDRMRWYERASELSCFHDHLAEMIENDIKDGITAEAGCGLGYLSEKLYRSGCNITAYDIDSTVLERARERSGLNIFRECDCYDIKDPCDYLIALFFGRITEGNNLEKLMRCVRRRLIYIIGGHSARHGTDDNVKDFLESRNINYSRSSIDLDFSQPLIDKADADRFLSEYYSGKEKEEKKKRIRPYGKYGYDYILDNPKKMTIYRIEKE